jgi:pimeloyl-ACP methyl ester carboxylesterase
VGRRSNLLGSVPALVLAGAEDQATTPELVRDLADALPQARFATIEGAGHLPCIERPQIMAAEMDRFFRENGYG